MRFFLLLFFSCLLTGCVLPGQSVYMNDPLTGGVDSNSSTLLHIPLPAGLQYYPSHSSISGGSRKEGLETLRGYVDQAACAMNFYSSLKQAGWQLRMSQRSGNRGIYIYQKDNEMTALVFQAQGMLTIVQIWLGARLADNAALSRNGQYDSVPSLPAEEYGPATTNTSPIAPKEEKWGLQERAL